MMEPRKQAFPKHDVIHIPTEKHPQRRFVKDPEGLYFEGFGNGHFDFSPLDAEGNVIPED